MSTDFAPASKETNDALNKLVDETIKTLVDTINKELDIAQTMSGEKVSLASWAMNVQSAGMEFAGEFLKKLNRSIDMTMKVKQGA